MKSLEQQLNEMGVNAMDLGSSPAFLEEHVGVDYSITFEAIEFIASHRFINGFGEVYSYLHDELNQNNVYAFLEKAEDVLGADSEAYDELENYIDSFVYDMLYEAEELVK